MSIIPSICGTNRNITDSINRSGAISIEEQHLIINSPLDDEWNITFGGDKSDYGYSVQQTIDEGYIITGRTESYSTGGGHDSDLWLIKTDENGNEQWNKTFGEKENDGGYSVRQTKDSGYIITGYTYSYGAGYSDVWLIKTDAYGNEEWNRTYGGTDSDIGFMVNQTVDSGYIIVGLTYSYAIKDVWVIKTDSLGIEEWNATSPTGTIDDFRPGAQTEDGGFIITGDFYHSIGKYYDALLIKLDANGSEQWKRSYGGAYYDGGSAVRQTNDSVFIVTGATQSYSAGYYDVWLIKTDAYGNEEWNKTFDAGFLEIGNSLEQTKDGGYIIVGMRMEWPHGIHDIILIKTDYKGNKEWNMTFVINVEDRGEDVQQTIDDGYIITGYTGLSNGLNYDVLLIKVSAFENQRPHQPTINGTIYGNTNRSYEYTIVATEPDNEDIYYLIYIYQQNIYKEIE